ncbi:MAG: hypothetical protein IJ516_05585 [Phascolarctobacterium sp.]|nr:hypothetical protein [Phascolarctobacterium sp.]
MIADIIQSAVWGSGLVEKVIYKGEILKAIVEIGGADSAKKNFFRGATINDTVKDEASFSFLEDDILGFKSGETITYDGDVWYIDRMLFRDTMAKSITLAASRKNKGFARGHGI